MSPLVSIIIPAYNAERYISETIQSTLNQEYPNIEIFVINDGSRDSTLEIAKRFESSQVKVIDQENRGAASARNQGLSLAQGEFVQHLDADDLLSPGKIKSQVHLLDHRRTCVAICSWSRFFENPTESWSKPESFWRDLSPLEYVTRRWELHSMMHPAAWLLPRQVLEKGGKWNESLSLDDDGDFFDRMAFASEQILFCPEGMTFYRSALPNSLSGLRTDAALRSAFTVVTLGAERLLSRDDSPRTRRACSRRLEEFVYDSFPAGSDLRKRAWAQVKSLGGPYYRPQMGPRMKLLSRVVGWRLALRLKRFLRRIA